MNHRTLGMKRLPLSLVTNGTEVYVACEDDACTVLCHIDLRDFLSAGLSLPLAVNHVRTEHHGAIVPLAEYMRDRIFGAQ